MYGWRKREDGVILIWDLPNGPERAPMLRVEDRADFDRGEAKFHELNEAAEQKYSLPRGWLAAMEWQESRFNPRAFRHEPNGWTGVGLLQITHPALKGKLTDDQLFDPSTNIDVGARHLANLRERYGDDFPRNSAAYNAGSARPDAGNPWNLHQYGNHVSSEVSALNYFLERGRAEHERELTYLEELAVSRQFDLAAELNLAAPSRSDEEFPPQEMDTQPEIVAALPRKDEEQS